MTHKWWQPGKAEARMATLEAEMPSKFGYASMRPFQREVIRDLLGGGKVLAVQPTGGGKSFTFQGPGIVLPGLTLVISPLLALMKDQVDKLQRQGVRADRIGGDQSVEEQRQVYRRLTDPDKDRRLDILYVSPERIKNKAFAEALAQRKIMLIALDEAHVLSKWGREFRPSYAQLRELTAANPDAAVLVVTATADQQVEADVVRLMGLPPGGYRRVIGAPDRENLTYTASQELNHDQLAGMVRSALAAGPGCALIYASTRKEVEEVCFALENAGVGFDGAYYHAGIEGPLRAVTQERFMAGDIRWMVATNAFGMGIDKSDVRLVVHWHQPGTVFDYAQEAGRAGRDGLPSTCHLNISRKGRTKRDYFIRMANPDLWVYEKLWRIITANGKHGAGVNARTSREYITTRMGLNKGISGQQDSALAYLEFTGHFEVVPGPTTYRLMVKNSSTCRRFANDYRCVRLAANVVTVTTNPEEENPVDSMISEGAVHPLAPGSVAEQLIFRILRGELGVTAEEVADKLARAEKAADQVEEFAAAPGDQKASFLRNVFLAAARA